MTENSGRNAAIFTEIKKWTEQSKRGNIYMESDRNCESA
jgi:hypothetical protein